MRRGFTLLELCFVVMILGILTAITVPAYDVILRRSHQAEARSMLSAIAHAQLQHHRDTGDYLACPASGDVPVPTARFPEASCWKTLGIQVGGAVRYRYGVEVIDGGFAVTAEGDLDRDGHTSRLTLSGDTLQIDIVDGLE
ncbi:MAG: prepilin-type N-terminal cleavage/methylation domain-containing protein [Myxococcota bacterium]|jgi:prepilin-type N-terminal cleavage/methylation domain-containing protein